MKTLSIYFLRDKTTGDWYARSNRWCKNPEGAAVWTNIAGPNAARGSITQRNRQLSSRSRPIREPEIKVITATPSENFDA
jgi:hypothetical protein